MHDVRHGTKMLLSGYSESRRTNKGSRESSEPTRSVEAKAEALVRCVCRAFPMVASLIWHYFEKRAVHLEIFYCCISRACKEI